MGIRREANACAFPLHSIAHFELPTFSRRLLAALQIAVGGFLPALSFTGHAGLPAVALAKAGRVTLPVNLFLSLSVSRLKLLGHGLLAGEALTCHNGYSPCKTSNCRSSSGNWVITVSKRTIGFTRKYSCTRMFLMPTISCHGISG